VHLVGFYCKNTFYASYLTQNLIFITTRRQCRHHPEAKGFCPYSVSNHSRTYINLCNKL